MTRVLVLGSSGMLGSMVFHYLSKNPELAVYNTVRDPKYKTQNSIIFDVNTLDESFTPQFQDLKLNYIINCIGITKPFSKDSDPEAVKRAIRINAEFPWKLGVLAKKRNVKVIQIATDCVYSGKKGQYKEDDPHDALDVYGKTKSLGEVFDGTTFNIRNSIIGPEPKKEKSYLLEWFLSQPDGAVLSGFEHHNWNGITTLQFAQLCEKIILKEKYEELLKISPIQHYLPNSTVTKYHLLEIFKQVFKKNVSITCVNKPEEKVDRTLASKFSLLESFMPHQEMKDAINTLENYMRNNPASYF